MILLHLKRNHQLPGLYINYLRAIEGQEVNDRRKRRWEKPQRRRPDGTRPGSLLAGATVFVAAKARSAALTASSAAALMKLLILIPASQPRAELGARVSEDLRRSRVLCCAGPRCLLWYSTSSI